ncbi:unnamed protein product [Ambrosiozyma monospora]|uniref:Unnamed protein product n=1 Tax=Ambrosiozyma monospora TaxID=43982 RepID=A0A9W7DLD6_AMBMO|nr:unnamed protein product [Ambrosiozyma monospora]
MPASPCSSPEHAHVSTDVHTSGSRKKKRVGKACDSCRLKKTKCSGKHPCEKCQADNKICIYTERKKSRDKVFSYEYVELIEKRLNMVNKSLMELCKMVKLEQTDQLSTFAKNLQYNAYDETTPISINQAITLLLDKQDIAELSGQDDLSALPDVDDVISKDHKSTSLKDSSPTDSSLLHNQQPSSSRQTHASSSGPTTTTISNSSPASSSTSMRRKKSTRRKKERTALSTDYNVTVSSPESLTPKSDEFSPLQNPVSTDNSDSYSIGNNNNGSSNNISNKQQNIFNLGNIKEEDQNCSHSKNQNVAVIRALHKLPLLQ